ncbi:MAG: CoA transferase [Candidatus Binatus sp.]|uniref:CaiB/BaiF CoA transferase family protein n=1 Tax=Candidatus Binatus sp. TaxID=2811406 RepID=UPI0027189174|nr:CoA transferase [Candidatus Binatus sp.]MDO8434150.1 CoA transferase [Candidatus Binatus sp.]
MANQAPRMLEGYRVLDFTQFVAGPTCTRILGEMGAEVIKVELAPAGDRVRGDGLKSLDPKYKDSSHSTYYLQHNHSKLSFAIDLKRPGAREIVMAMIPQIDVVVENFAPHVIDRLGFSYNDVKKVNPKIIMCSISMGGQTGPLSTKAGYDFIGQAYAGVTDGIGQAGGPPALTSMAIGDISTGVNAAMAVGFALLHRERTGEGQYLDASLLDTYFHMHEKTVPIVSLRGDKFRPTRSGSVHPDGGTTGIYHFRGDQYVQITVPPHQWPQLLRAMKMPELGTDPRFKNARGRRDNKEQLVRVIEEWLGTFPTRDDAIAAMDAERVPCAPVLTVNEAVKHPHLNERKTVRWIDDPLLGKVALPGMPVKFSAWPDRIDVHASRLGEDNERVLGELLKMPADRVRELYAEGILVRDPTLENNPSA